MKVVWYKSLFFKLAVAVLAIAILGNFFIGWSFRRILHPQRVELVSKNIEMYISFLSKQLGDPPLKKSALDFSNQLGLDIFYADFSKKKIIWSTDPKQVSLDLIEKRGRLHKHGAFFYEGSVYKSLSLKSGYLIFSVSLQKHFIINEYMLLAIFGFTVAIFLLAYYMVRKILGPIKDLNKAVGRLAAGDFSSTMKILRGDELGQLGLSFNSMADKINEMMEQKNHLLRHVGHEIKTPLTRMKLQLEFLKDKKIRKSLIEDIDRLNLLTQKVLEYHRQETILESVSSEIDVTQVIKKLIQYFGKDQKRISVTSPLPEKLLIAIKEEDLYTALKNVIENALKYSSKKPIKIEIGETQNEKFIRIQDFGKGITAEELKNMGKPFYKVNHPAYLEKQGFGLGLSICKKIIENTGGNLTFQSKENIGTQVTFHWPVSRIVEP